MRAFTQRVTGSLIAVLLLLFAGSAQAQYFGRNKVQWQHFDFKTVHTPHFDIYYYDEEKDIVDDVGRMAERWYFRLSRSFDHQFVRKPIVLYANSADFQQTTTTSGLIGAETGGFTDPIQNRVVLPLTGDYAENDHVLGHELVHVFQFDIANKLSSGANRRRFNIEALPLWLIEGMAEYFSRGRVDPLTAMWIRDATEHDRLPDINKLTRDPRYFPYRYGQALLAYVGSRWGDDQVVRLFLAAGLVGPQEAFDRALGVRADQVFRDWHAAARELYEPVFLRRPQSLGTPIVGGRKGTRGELNVSPSLSPDGRFVAFLTSRDLFDINLYLADAKTGAIIRKLVSNDSNPHFEALRFIDSSGSWSPDSQKLAFVVFERGDNYLGIVDVNTRSIENIRVPGVSSMTNPAWSPDGHTIAFSGQTTGATDLFTYDLQSKSVRRLMNDKYADLQPAFSPDGHTIAFVSDRGTNTSLEQLRFSDFAIFTVDTNTGTISQVPGFDGAKHINPQFGPDGKSIYFIANPSGIPDVFRYASDTNALTQITHVPTGVSGITETSPALSVAMKTGDVAISLYENDGYNLYNLGTAPAGEAVSANLGSSVSRASLLPPLKANSTQNYTVYLQRPSEGLPGSGVTFTRSGYSNALHLTYLGPPTVGVGADRFGYGVGGSVSAYFSDVLGEHNIGFSFQGGGTSGQGVNFTDTIGADVIYLNQKNRFNWGASASHTPYVSSLGTSFGQIMQNGQVFDVVQQPIQVVTVDDVALLAQYPLSQTRRFETSGGYQRYAFKTSLITDFFDLGGNFVGSSVEHLDKTSLNMFRGSAAFVGDSAIFGFISPIRGTRYRFEGEAITGDLKFETALIDYRKYLLFRPVTIAGRFLHYGRYGNGSEDTRLSPLFLGDPGLVRGYDYSSFSGSECISPTNAQTCPVFDRLIGSKVALASIEARVPLFGTREYGLINAPFLPTELVAFVDAGVAWTEARKPKLRFDRGVTEEQIPVVSVGISTRILLAYIPIELYWAKPLQRPGKNLVFGFNITPGW
jgi:Peptidase of plants and bacteria/WD40-like Beta Propeller Repeat